MSTDKVNLLLVDDRPDALLVLEAVLNLPEYNLVKAHSGAEALALIRGHDYAVILMDVQMPHMNGFETANLIKQIPEARDIPIIFVTAINKDYRYVRQGYQAGAVDYLFKPFDMEVLRSKVAVFADLYRKNQKIQHQSDELHQKEKELHQARRLEAVGRLAGGVAHDFNNLLTGILGIAQELRSELEDWDPRAQELDEIVKASQRAFSLTRQLLAFGRRQLVAPRVLDLNTAVRDLQNMLKRLVGEDIHLEATLCERPPLVKIDPSQLEQVVLNLVLNARDALPKGGRIEITTDHVHFTESHPRFGEGARPGHYVQFTVRDNGCGMDAETLARIFEPFFTTKENRGTGLGLSTVYGIVKQNNGEVFVESQPGEGSLFCLFLPLATEGVDVMPIEPVVQTEGGKETILVVEDEDIVRHVVRNLLNRQGYRVWEAKDGPHALTIARDNPGAINLAVTDVVMPGMNGRQLADALAETQPTMAVLFISAYSEDIIANKGILEPGIAFLEKSTLHSSLALKVRDLLDRRAAQASAETPEQPLWKALSEA